MERRPVSIPCQVDGRGESWHVLAQGFVLPEHELLVTYMQANLHRHIWLRKARGAGDSM